jgi:hypothetical protein
MPIYFPDTLEHNNPNLKLMKDGFIDYEIESANRTIYVVTTGSDTTGDGSVSLPYATIEKALSTIKKIIISGVTVTISLGVGTFTLSKSDISTLSSITRSGSLTIQGTLTLVESGFTIGSSQALDPLTYAVSGGNTATWTTNQWKGYFIYNGTDYFPISHNTTNTLSAVRPGIGNSAQIYEAKTIINVAGTANTISNNCELTFIQLTINFTGNTILNSLSTNQFILNKCKINLTTSINFAALCRINILLDIFIGGTVTSVSQIAANFNGVYIYATSSSQILNFNSTVISTAAFTNVVLENYHVSGIGFSMNSPALCNQASWAAQTYIKFINCNSCIGYTTSSNIVFNPDNPYLKFIIVNCPYFFKKTSTTLGDYFPLNLTPKYSIIIGTPTTRWFYDPMYELVNQSTNRNIQISGITYPEFEPNLSSTLPDNATTNVTIGATAQNRSIAIDYTITRGTTYETGTLRVLYDGTNVTLQTGTPIGSTGTSFAVDISSGLIRLKCTLTSTGTAGTMKYNVNRVMITPLTI